MANIEIGGRLHSTATGNVVTGANEVLDDTKNKKQSVINAEVDETIGDDNTAGTIKGRIKTAEGKLDTLNGDSSTSGSVAKAVADAKTELIGGATSNGNTLKKVEDRTATLETAVGSNGSVDQRIAAAKSEVIGDAASDYNTLGKLEDKIQAEASARESAVSTEAQARQDAITAETNRATTRENQIYDLVHTPEQHYVTVATYADLANIASPSDDTVYRVSSYNGKTSQVDNTVYSEYGYNGTNFVFLCVKSQIDEVYDISVHHSNNTYVDLAAALDGGNNIPQELRRGGMSVKFIQSSDNNYVQYRYMGTDVTTAATFTNVDNWQGVDDVPTAGSDNLVKSGGVYNDIHSLGLLCNASGKTVSINLKPSFSLAGESGYGSEGRNRAIARFEWSAYKSFTITIPVGWYISIQSCDSNWDIQTNTGWTDKRTFNIDGYTNIQIILKDSSEAFHDISDETFAALTVTSVNHYVNYLPAAPNKAQLLTLELGTITSAGGDYPSNNCVRTPNNKKLLYSKNIIDILANIDVVKAINSSIASISSNINCYGEDGTSLGRTGFMDITDKFHSFSLYENTVFIRVCVAFYDANNQGVDISGNVEEIERLSDKLLISPVNFGLQNVFEMTRIGNVKLSALGSLCEIPNPTVSLNLKSSFSLGGSSNFYLGRDRAYARFDWSMYTQFSITIPSGWYIAVQYCDSNWNIQSNTGWTDARTFDINKYTYIQIILKDSPESYHDISDESFEALTVTSVNSNYNYYLPAAPNADLKELREKVDKISPTTTRTYIGEKISINKEYDLVDFGEYPNGVTPTQGMAIYDNYCVQGSSTESDGKTMAALIHMQARTKIADILLSHEGYSAIHCNTMCFGNEFAQDGVMPLLYASQWDGESCCFVYDIQTDGTSTLKQVISPANLTKDGIKFGMGCVDWVVDTDHNWLFAISYKNTGYNIGGQIVTKFALPKLSDGALVELSDDDIIGYNNIGDYTVRQDGCYNGNRLYLIYGAEGASAQYLALHIVDVFSMNEVSTINLQYINAELEGLDIYDGSLILHTLNTNILRKFVFAV